MDYIKKLVWVMIKTAILTVGILYVLGTTVLKDDGSTSPENAIFGVILFFALLVTVFSIFIYLDLYRKK